MSKLNNLVLRIIEEEFKTQKFLFKELSNQGNAHVFKISILDSSKNVVNIKDYNQDYILRISKNNPYIINNNIIALDLLQEEKISPKIIRFGKQGNLDYSIESFVEGKIINNLTNLDSSNFSKFVKTLLKLHSIKNEKCGYINNLKKNWKKTFLEMGINNYKEKFEKNCKDKKYYEYLIKNIPPTQQFSLIHGDLYENMMFDENKEIILFDFEGCFYGDAVYDLSYLHFRRNFSEEEISALLTLTGYDKNKFYYYVLAVYFRKVALSPENEVEKRLEKLEEIYNILQKN